MSMDLFNGPIPGQSLSKPMGASPVDNPPQYSNLEDALNHVFETLTQPRQIVRLVLLLKKGVPVEYIARSIIFMGFGKGMWSPDVGLMMLRTVMLQISSIAHIKGIKHVIFNPDKAQNDFLDQFLDMAPEENPVKDNKLTESPAAPKFTGLLGGNA